MRRSFRQIKPRVARRTGPKGFVHTMNLHVLLLERMPSKIQLCRLHN